MFRLQVICFVVLTGYTGCKQPNRQESLHFNPTPAVLYRITVSHQTDQQWVYQGKPYQAADSRQTSYGFQLLHKTDSLFLMKLVFDTFRAVARNYRINTNAQHVSLNETNTNPLLLYDYLLHFAKGQYVTVWMNEKGRPLQVSGIEKIIDSVAKISGVTGDITRKYLENFISDVVIKDELNQLFCFIPGKPKSPGQMWVENIVLVAKAPVKWSGSFTAQSIAGDTAVISCQSFISARQGGETGRTYMKGKLTGNITVNYKTGMPYTWNAQSNTITNTDSYDISTSQVLTAGITTVRQ
jgi:hypothetical protein